MNTATICIMIVVLLYLGLMLFVGLKFAKGSSDASNFYLGGRKLGPLVTAMSAEASDMSSYLLMGLPGLAYLSGVADVGWTVIGLAAGTYLNWLIVSKRLRVYTQITGSFTIPQFFSDRFKDSKKILSTIASVVIIVFFVPYTASGFAACGKIFAPLFDMDYMTVMLIAAAVIILYTTLGGFMAASTTDFMQSIVMTFALAFILIYATIQAGGIGAVIENGKALPGYLSLTETYNAADGTSSPYTFLTIISTLAWGLGYFGMPHILLRFMAIEDKNKLKLSRRVASIWVVIAMAVAVGIGIIGKALSDKGVIGALSGNDTESIIIKISDFLASNGVFLALIAGLVLAGILASTMSTADSQLLAASSSMSQNILQDTFKLKLTNKQSMIIARVTVIVISIIAIFIAQDPDSSIFTIVSFAWAGFGAAFGPIVLCALFWKRTTLPGAIAGMIGGGAMVFIWKFLIRPLGGAWNIYELLPAFIVNIILVVVISLLTKKPGKEIEDQFDEMKKSVNA